MSGDLQEYKNLRTLLQGHLLKSSLLSLRLPASEADAPSGTDDFDRYHGAEHHSFEDAGPSRDMHIESPEEGIAPLDCSLYQSQVYWEYLSHRYLF